MKRLLKWGTLLVFLIICAFAANFIIKNFTGIGPVPVRSAFAGRLPWLQEGDKRRFQFFYATNRKNDEETFNGQGNNLGESISTGTFDVLISPYLQISPFIWFDRNSMEWAGRSELTPDNFKLKLKEAIQSSPQKSILIIVWGFRDWFTSAALKSAYTAYALDINTPVLLFDWPGNQGEGSRGYFASQLVATQSAPDLGRILTAIIQDTDAQNIWIMGSSLGCQTICDSLKWLMDQPNLFKGHTKLSHVVLSAPDVSAQAFDEKFSEAIMSLSRYLSVYVSSNDRALLMSHWLNGGRRLGRTAEITLPPSERVGEYEFEEALELMELQEKGLKNTFIIDATPINFLRNLHHFFTDSAIFFDDLYQRLLKPNDIVNRPLHEVRTGQQGQSYWILWNE